MSLMNHGALQVMLSEGGPPVPVFVPYLDTFAGSSLLSAHVADTGHTYTLSPDANVSAGTMQSISSLYAATTPNVSIGLTSSMSFHVAVTLTAPASWTGNPILSIDIGPFSFNVAFNNIQTYYDSGSILYCPVLTAGSHTIIWSTTPGTPMVTQIFQDASLIGSINNYWGSSIPFTISCAFNAHQIIYNSIAVYTP